MSDTTSGQHNSMISKDEDGGDLPDSWPTIKRKVLPARPEFLPALRLELVGVRTIDILSAMHDKDLVVDLLSLLDKDRGFSVRSASNWKGSVADGGATVSWNNGIDSKCCLKSVGNHENAYCVLTLVHNILKILHLLDLLKGGGVGANSHNLRSQLVEDIRSTSKNIPNVGKKTGSGVATS